MKKPYYGFTIIELLGAIIIISVALLSILSLLRVAVAYTNKTRQETIAINLAREAIEGVYSRRNTNWLRQSGEKDKNWLNIDNQTGTSANRFQGSGALYRLRYDASGGYGKTAIFTNASSPYISSSIAIDNTLLLGTGDFIGGVPPEAAGKFYRAIVGGELYSKNTPTLSGNLITTCINGITNKSCGDDTPKEYRFCSRVEYQKDFKGKVELCGSITNYQE